MQFLQLQLCTFWFQQDLGTVDLGDRMINRPLFAAVLSTLKYVATLICIICVVNVHWLNYQGEATICDIMGCGTVMQYPNLSSSIFP